MSHIGMHGSGCLHPHSPPILFVLEGVHEECVKQFVQHLLQTVVVYKVKEERKGGLKS